jgi:mannose-6-phosphate isomerase-like protein (cupin superfamily)
MHVINITQKFSLIQEFWQPKIAGELNDSYIKFARLKGEFIWHKHEIEDELFLVIKGNLRILLRDKELSIAEGEFVIIPHGVEHLPVADEEVHVVLIEPKSTLNTGNVHSERTIQSRWI